MLSDKLNSYTRGFWDRSNGFQNAVNVCCSLLPLSGWFCMKWIRVSPFSLVDMCCTDPQRQELQGRRKLMQAWNGTGKSTWMWLCYPYCFKNFRLPRVGCFLCHPVQKIPNLASALMEERTGKNYHPPFLKEKMFLQGKLPTPVTKTKDSIPCSFLNQNQNPIPIYGMTCT